MKPSVEVSHLGMMFNLSKEMHDTLKDYFINLFKHHEKMKKDEFWALSDVSFKLYPGDRLGILGLNGAGKSTILKAIAGVYHPTTGSIHKRGKLAPLLELGAGFEPQYSARENIYLYGSILGYSKEFIESKFDEIIEFAELQKFVEVPVKNYSSGMKSRLGFAICTAVNPDILILDEVLSVGDKKFRRKSEDKIMSMLNGEVTVLFVSHSLEQVRRICNKAMILDHGKLKCFGDINEIAPIYAEMTQEDPEEIKKREAKAKANREKKLREARKTKAHDIINMTNNLDISVEDAMAAIDIPEDKYKTYYKVIDEIEKEEGILTKQDALKAAAAEEAEFDRAATFPNDEDRAESDDDDFDS
ncbi:MAG: ABC transporter ATP-binding protein [Lachnospiraceae bacterium]|uniref:ABC transporter ATP-binding protein n=1 Tax=Candidatus Weimeria bifida TaxID=2599074 RepID=A0A6N7IZW2_9FIRM|nr:ABC transporter ATP-binding protein [Candidatus Weimeria bifida]RRF96445.1 MAG: ABC transporter ATP-binding protein [Lachnospiraceae bacterium]